MSRSKDAQDSSLEWLGNIRVPGSPEAFWQSLSTRRANVARVRRDVDTVPFEYEPIDWYRWGKRPTESCRPSRHLQYAAGDYYIQDAGSLLALAAIEAEGESLAGQRICDLCAAPGGKATALVEAVGESGFVLANEPIRSRLGALQLNLARTGSDRYAISNLDPEALAQQLPRQFDRVLVDAPCSGQAMLARGKQGRSSLAPKQIRHSAMRQQRILDAAVQLLRPGGVLVYSTCTFAHSENEAQVARLVDERSATPAPIGRLDAYESDPACYRLWPHLHDCGGGFAARLIVEQNSGEDETPMPRSTRRRGHRCSVELDSWYRRDDREIQTMTGESSIWTWPVDVPSWVEAIAVSGPEVAHRVGDVWRPSHAGSLRRDSPMLPLQHVEVDAESAASFFRGEPIAVAGCPQEGWIAVSWLQRPLGWVKLVGGIGKNHLPSAARFPNLFPGDK